MTSTSEKVTSTFRACMLAMVVTGTLVSCGGGGGGSTSTAPPATQAATPITDGVIISGIVSKGLITDAFVKVFFSSDGVVPANMIPRVGDTVVEVPVDSDGRYTATGPQNAKTVVAFVVPTQNSSMKDEATGVNVALPSLFQMGAALDLTDSTAKKIDMHITPFTQAAVALAAKSGGFTSRVINMSNSGVANIIGLDPVGTKPIQSSDASGLANASSNEKKYSLLNAVISSNAASDVAGCGAQTSFGASINCAISKTADHFQLSTVNGIPVATYTELGRQQISKGAEVVRSTVTALKEVVVELKNEVKANAVSPITYATVIGSSILDNSQRRDTVEDYQNKVANNGTQITSAAVTMNYAVMSKLVYSDDWTNGGIGKDLNGALPLSTPLNSTQYTVSEAYTALKLTDYGVNTDWATSNNLSWGVFYNDREVVFAYRGTDGASNIISDLETAACLNLLYPLAKSQFDTLVTNPKFVEKFLTPSKKHAIVLTGHSLGGGIASYIATWSENANLIYQAIGFNSAPLCTATAALAGKSPLYQDPKIFNLRIDGEAVSVVTAGFRNVVYFPGITIPYPSPYIAAVNQLDNHFLNTVLFTLNASKNLCSTNSNCISKTQSLATPGISFAIASLIPSYASTSTSNNPPIIISGANLSLIDQIIWTCSQTNGGVCPIGGYTWTTTSPSWNAVSSDSTATLYPTLLNSSFAPGTYNWTVAFSSRGSAPVTKSFSVTYQPQAATGVVVDGMSSPQFAQGTTSVASTVSPVTPSITVTGKNLSTVARIEWRWSGATSGSASWTKGDANWNSKVTYTADGRLILSPTVIENTPNWTGTSIWTGTLLNAAGQSQNITFSVAYKAPTGFCPANQSLVNGQCVTATPVCSAPQVLTNGICVNPPTPAAMTAPTLMAPANNATGQSLTPTLQWSGGSATYWQVNVRNVGTGALHTSAALPSSQMSYTVPGGVLQAGIQYRWDVSACPNTACISGYVTSGNFFFTTAATAGNYQLTLSTVGNGTIRDGGGFVCPPSCSNNYVPGANVTLTPTAGAGSTFTGWSGACTGTGACVVAMSAAKSVTATFTGAVTMTAPALMAPANNATGQSLTPTLQWSGGSATYWQVNVRNVGTGALHTSAALPSSQMSYTVPGGVLQAGIQYRWDVSACPNTACISGYATSGNAFLTTAAANGNYQLTLSVVGNGTIRDGGGFVCPPSCSNSYVPGANVTLTPTAGSGSTFAGWSGACTGTGACVVAMSAAKSVTATFTGAVTMTAPALMAPANNATGQSLTPTLQWSGGSATYWQVNVRNVGTGALHTSAALPSSQMSYTVPGGVLQAGIQYRWDVSACPNTACISGYVTSGNFYFTTAAAAPIISSLSATSLSGSCSAQPLTIYGSNFVNGATVDLYDQTNSVSYSGRSATFSAGQLSLSATYGGASSNWTATVVNPNGSRSSAVGFSIVGPSITGVSPNPVPRLATQQSITFFGSGFQSGAAVEISDGKPGSPYVKTPISLSSGQFTISAILTTAPATWTVKIRNCPNLGDAWSPTLNF